MNGAATIDFLQDMAVVTGVAGITVLLLHRLKFPMVFGLLLAGLIVGPNTPPFSLVKDPSTLQTLADLGIVLLLFGLGLEFDLRGLRRNAKGVAIITAVEILLMFGIGYEVARLMGWTTIDSIFLGAMLSISSTAIIITVLRELGRMDRESSRVLFAVLVLEDIAAILILVIVSGYAATGGLPLQDAVIVLTRMGLFLLALGLFGLALVPRIVNYVWNLQRPEILVLTVLGLALGAAVISDISGFHVGLGSFLMGALVAESAHAKQIDHQIRPVHDLFAAVFFVAIGSQVQLDALQQFWLPTVIVVVAVVVGKLVSGAAATFLVGYSPMTAISVGAALAQVGEFSFVIAAVGLSTGTMEPTLFSIVVAASAVTSFASPMLMRYDLQLANGIRRLAPRSMRTYAQVYHQWIAGMKDKPVGAHDPVVRQERIALITAAGLLISVTGASLALQRPVAALLPPTTGPLIYWGIVLTLTVPLVFELYRHARNWIQRLGILTADAGLGFLRPGNVVLYSMLLLATVVAGLAISVASLPLLDTPVVAIIWIAVVGAASILLAQRVRRLHTRVQQQLEALLRDKQLPVSTEDALQLMLKQALPSDATTDTLVVDREAWIVGKRVGEIDVRRAVGATLLVVERSHGPQEVPTAQTTILPGDRLTLMGSGEQLKAARSLLTRRLDRQEIVQGVRPGNLFVPATSRVAQQPLAQVDLRNRFGLQIVAVRRLDKTHVNPHPDFVVSPDDVLVVVGPSHRIVEAERWIQEPPQPGAPRSDA